MSDFTDRELRVMRFALYRLVEAAREFMVAAAQDVNGEHFKPGAVAAFQKDAADAGSAMAKIDAIQKQRPQEIKS